MQSMRREETERIVDEEVRTVRSRIQQNFYKVRGQCQRILKEIKKQIKSNSKKNRVREDDKKRAERVR